MKTLFWARYLFLILLLGCVAYLLYKQLTEKRRE